MDEISVHIIPHRNQKYSTCGDYWELGERWDVRISKTEDWRHSYLVLIHELTEMALTKNDGVNWDDIDKFDMEGDGKDHPDPGTLKSAPYHKQHLLATVIERRLAKMLNVDWDEYNEALDSLEYK